MHGWAKNIKQHFPKAVIREGKDYMEASLGDELLLSVIRDGRGSMVDNQKESHAKYSLSQVQDPSWAPGKIWNKASKKWEDPEEDVEAELDEEHEDAPVKKPKAKKGK